jgi:hypothetical protein
MNYSSLICVISPGIFEMTTTWRLYLNGEIIKKPFF